MPRATWNVWERASVSALPNCVVGTGAGNVTWSMPLPVVSANCMRMAVTVKLTRSFGSTTMTSGTLNGATDGQDGLLTSCATATDDVALTETADGGPANGLGRITSGCGSLSVHDVARKAATTRSGTRWCMTLPPF